VSSLLLIEDDATIGDLLAGSLRTHGHEVWWEQTGRAGLGRAAGTDFDLILLDLGLPDLDGVEVCRRLRTEQPGTVLVMLTARTTEMDVVVGLEAGADDYLTKPVRLTELHARVRAHLRRAALAPAASAVYALGGLVVDAVGRRVTVAGRELRLRAKEFDLLARLAADPGVALTRERLMAEVWDEHWFGPTKTLDVHIAALRRKLADIAASTGAHVPEIITLRGHGYRLELGRGPGEV
jgi:DNA-binding response OmpR family regulator